MSKIEWQRNWRRTKNGIVQQCWFTILYNTKHHKNSAYGVSHCTKDEFYEWAKSDPELDRLIEQWEDSDYNKRYKPCIMRLNTRAGYHPMFLTWTTREEIWREGAFHANGGIR